MGMIEAIREGCKIIGRYICVGLSLCLVLNPGL